MKRYGGKGRCPRLRDPPPVPALKAWEGNDVLDARPILRCEEKGNRGERMEKVNGGAKEWRGKGKGKCRSREETGSGGWGN